MQDKKAILTLREPFDKLIAASDHCMYRTRSQRIRTTSLPLQVKIPCPETVAIYQILAPKIQELKALGMFNAEIALRLDINIKTVKRGLDLQS